MKIVSLDTSTTVCSIAIHENAQLMAEQSYYLKQSHSTLLPAIIKEMLTNCELTFEDIDAIAISAGPGSYTGLRIGTATAKGLAYSLDKPLIAVDTLDTMVAQVLPFMSGMYLLCPMIDARRMEVYCKIVDQDHLDVRSTSPLIVDENSFNMYNDQTVYLFGNGAIKLKELLEGSNVKFIDGIHPHASAMGGLAADRYNLGQFEDLAYFEPDYLKEYRINVPSQKFKL